ncbi:hypothetical protein Tco_1193945 [Tanacetum coccineum]
MRTKIISTLPERQAGEQEEVEYHFQEQSKPTTANKGKILAKITQQVLPHGEKKYYGGSKPLSPTSTIIIWSMSDCPERKNRNHENQTRGAGARGAVHALREGETDQDPNNIKDEIKA